jgi:uncharacterized membrane protein (TIGR02234 family)
VNSRKFKTYSLTASFVFSALVLMSWSQPWFILAVTLSTENSDGLEVSGQIAAPGLSAFGLAGFAVTAALALSSPLIRRILSVLIVLIGLAVFMVSLSALSDPALASAPQLTSLSAISDIQTLKTFVISSTATVWPGLSAAAGILLIPVGIVVFLTASQWGTGSRKFDRVTQSNNESSPRGVSSTTHGTNVDTSSENIDAWDSLSHGTDPTIN